MLEVKSTATPDSTTKFPNGYLNVFNLPGLSFGAATFEPGWQWSVSVKPTAGTDSCQVPHAGLCLSGQLCVLMDDGETAIISPGDLFVISPGHDAWTVGNVSFVGYDFGGGMSEYAKA